MKQFRNMSWAQQLGYTHLLQTLGLLSDLEQLPQDYFEFAVRVRSVYGCLELARAARALGVLLALVCAVLVLMLAGCAALYAAAFVLQTFGLVVLFESATSQPFVWWLGQWVAFWLLWLGVLWLGVVAWGVIVDNRWLASMRDELLHYDALMRPFLDHGKVFEQASWELLLRVELEKAGLVAEHWWLMQLVTRCHSSASLLLKSQGSVVQHMARQVLPFVGQDTKVERSKCWRFACPREFSSLVGHPAKEVLARYQRYREAGVKCMHLLLKLEEMPMRAVRALEDVSFWTVCKEQLFEQAKAQLKSTKDCEPDCVRLLAILQALVGYEKEKWSEPSMLQTVWQRFLGRGTKDGQNDQDMVSSNEVVTKDTEDQNSEKTVQEEVPLLHSGQEKAPQAQHSPAIKKTTQDQLQSSELACKVTNQESGDLTSDTVKQGRKKAVGHAKASANAKQSKRKNSAKPGKKQQEI